MPDDDDDDVPGVTDSKHGLIMALAKARQERNKYRDEATKLRTDYETAAKTWEEDRAKLSAVDPTIETDRAELAQLRESSAAWQVERDLLAAGLTDPEGMEYARHAYGRVAEADRPKGGIGEWLKGDKLPRAVSAYLPTADAGKQTTTSRAVDPNKGVTQPRGVAAPAKTPESMLADGTWKDGKEAWAAENGIKLPDLKTAYHRPA